MKSLLIAIKKHIIILYILIILFPFNLSKYINKQNKKIVDIINKNLHISEFINIKKLNQSNINKNLIKSKEKDNDNKDPHFDPFQQNKTEKDDKKDHSHGNIFDDDDEERRKQEIDNITQQIRELVDKIDDLNKEITKRKIYIVFLAIITIILFLIIVIYSSIKCYILCVKKHLKNYRVSYINENRLGEVYIDENGEERIDVSMNKSKDECEAPSYSKIYKGNNYSTFNPDNYRASDEDKDLYKPYNNEDFQ